MGQVGHPSPGPGNHPGTLSSSVYVGGACSVTLGCVIVRGVLHSHILANMAPPTFCDHMHSCYLPHHRIPATPSGGGGMFTYHVTSGQSHCRCSASSPPSSCPYWRHSRIMRDSLSNSNTHHCSSQLPPLKRRRHDSSSEYHHSSPAASLEAYVTVDKVDFQKLVQESAKLLAFHPCLLQKTRFTWQWIACSKRRVVARSHPIFPCQPCTWQPHELSQRIFLTNLAR